MIILLLERESALHVCQKKLLRKHVSSIENGHTKLSLATLLGIAQSLDTTVDQLLYDNTPVLVSKFDADIKELTSDCSNQEKEFLLEIIKSTKTALRNYKPVK